MKRTPSTPSRGQGKLRTTRREFVGSLATVPAAVGLSYFLEAPEVILVNGDFLTQDAARPRARAMAIANGRILEVGSDTEIRRLAGPGTRACEKGTD